MLSVIRQHLEPETVIVYTVQDSHSRLVLSFWQGIDAYHHPIMARSDKWGPGWRTDWIGPRDLLPGMRSDSLMPSSWFCRHHKPRLHEQLVLIWTGGQS